MVQIDIYDANIVQRFSFQYQICIGSWLIHVQIVGNIVIRKMIGYITSRYSTLGYLYNWSVLDFIVALFVSISDGTLETTFDQHTLISHSSLCNSICRWHCNKRDQVINEPWWRHQMDTFSALLALCHRSPVNSQHKGQWRGALMLSLICTWING